MSTPELSLSQIDDDISRFKSILLPLPRSHPLRPSFLHSLAQAQLCRYTLSDQKEDLDNSILHFTEVLLLPHPLTESDDDIVRILFHLTFALLRRSVEFKQSEDVTYSIEYLHYLRDQPLETSGIPHQQVTSFLVEALALQVELKSSNVIKSIEEMAILCHELLTLDNLTGFPTRAIITLARVAIEEFSLLNIGKRPLGQVIECLREAHTRLPDLQRVSFALAWSLVLRFDATFSTDDYEEATIILDSIATSDPPGDSSESYKTSASKLVTLIAYGRATSYGNPEYLEESISRFRALLGIIPLSDPLRPHFARSLANCVKMRSELFGVGGGLEEERSSTLALPSFQHLAASVAKWNVDQSQPSMQGEEFDQHLNALRSVNHLYDMADVEEAIKYCRTLLASPLTINFLKYATSWSLTILLRRRFECTNKLEYLDESIIFNRDVLKMPSAKNRHLPIASKLITSLSSRLVLLGRIDDFVEMLQLFPIAANDRHASVPDRFQFSCFWAEVMQRFGHPSASSVYDNSMSLMQDSLTFAPTLHIQHSRLVSMRNNYEKLPLDYASYQIQTGRLRKAIETLDRGRALIWSEMRGLRTSIHKLLQVDSSLANRFASVNQELESLTLSVSSSGNADDAAAQGPDGMDTFGHLVIKQRKLLEERDQLILQIKALPSFEDFLKVPHFDTLRSAASQGPVITINHSRWRSDIIIILHDSSPSLITTPDDFYERAKGLRDKLVAARDEGLDSKNYDDALSSVLEGLYDLVGQPVIERLHALNIPDRSRIWWCPTSVFCSLPFTQWVQFHQTTASNTLIDSRKSGSQGLKKPSVLLMAQPDETLPGAWEEMEVVQAVNAKVTTLIGEMATPTAVLEALQDHEFAHFVCHGTLETGKPFDASFELYGGERLTLLDIVRSQLPAAEFAFLSACHTAELTDESMSDEALHLAAAMQYCGFRSVVGTMWAMLDEDGRDLSKHFYKSVFSRREGGVPYYERSAKALRDAVKKLRRKRGMTLERWVNFVHYGA
ncbi:CHAT domain-containing protein [Multifurca ochricompacta]|uniref:CHAT domain-containing protein n=1 Tax=Multifurca ochricompacta TaxID=376703 RepID=A0AAD4QL06_9AGAM|nr:CHAT domain-containing protein [Multifurca ochricompacta]